jgi:Sulfotransferase family
VASAAAIEKVLMSRADLRVLYVLGIHHSGTTVLSNLMAQLDGFFSVGELRTIWPKLTRPESRCGCGVRLQECDVWSRILRSTFREGQDREAIARDIWQLQRDALREYHTWLRVPALLRSRARDLPQDSSAVRYAQALASLYQHIAEETGAEVIIDSSKEPSDAALLLLMPEVDATFVQIIRDPRGSVYSILRARGNGEPDTESSWRQSVYAALSWSAGNLAGAAVRRASGRASSTTLRYEDFVRQPRQAVEALATVAGRPARLAPSSDPRTVTMGPTHTVGGNNNRFQTGEIQLRDDTQWRSGMPRLDRATVTTLCFPMMARYRYKLIS